MTFPNNKEKYSKPPILYPELLQKNKLISLEFKPPNIIFLCYSDSFFDLIVKKFKNTQLKENFGDLRVLKNNNGKIGILGKFGIGGPVTAVLTENLAYWGVKTIISIGLGSSLQKQIQTGDIILAEKAIRDDGTSYHYEQANKYASAPQNFLNKISNMLSKSNISFYVGPIWTTDAVYRETEDEVIEYQKESIFAVDMETATLYTVGKYCNLSYLSIIGISDSIASLKWEYNNNMDQINENLLNLFNKLLEFLNNE